MQSQAKLQQKWKDTKYFWIGDFSFLCQALGKFYQLSVTCNSLKEKKRKNNCWRAILSPLISVRLPSSQWQDASSQLNKEEAGWGEVLRVWQAAQVQRATEREQLSIQRHRGPKGRGLYARPAFQPNHRQQRSHTRGESKKTYKHHFSLFLQVCLAVLFSGEKECLRGPMLNDFSSHCHVDSFG